MHKIKRKSGEDAPKEDIGEDEQFYPNPSLGMIPSMGEFPDKGFPSAYSLKSKVLLPAITTQHLNPRVNVGS